MSVCGLLSGGKDSIFNLLQCQNIGLKIEVLATLYPPSGVQELDSYMYQSVGSAGVISQARCMNLPLLRREIRGKQLSLDMGYQKVDDDEVEDLFLLLADVKNLYPSVKYISTGAIASDYQRIRVENVCKRLGLQNISFLWHIPQPILLKWMCFSGMKAHLIKVAASGLKPSKFLGRTLNEVFSQLMDQEKIYKLNVCGEGGEFESLVAYCPGLFTEGKLNINVPQREREKEDENEKGQQNEFKVKRVINGDERFGDPVAWLEFNCPPPIVSLNEDELKAISKFTLNSSEQIPIPLSTTNIFKRLLDIFLISQQDILRVGEIIQFNFIIDSQLIKDIDSYHLFQLEMDQSITQFFLEIQTKNLYNINHNPTTRLSFFQSNNYSEQINNAFLEVQFASSNNHTQVISLNNTEIKTNEEKIQNINLKDTNRSSGKINYSQTSINPIPNIHSIVCVESLSLGFKPIPQFTSQCIGSGPLLELSDLHIPRESIHFTQLLKNQKINEQDLIFSNEIQCKEEEYNTSIINSQIAPHQISYALFLRQLIQGAFIKTKYSSNQPQSVLSQLVSDKLRDIIGIVDGSLGGSFFNDCLGIIVHVCQLNQFDGKADIKHEKINQNSDIKQNKLNNYIFNSIINGFRSAAKELSLIKALTRKIVKNPDFFETLIPVQVKEKEKEDDGDESNDSDDGDDENELNTILSIEPSDSIKINQVIPPLLIAITNNKNIGQQIEQELTQQNNKIDLNSQIIVSLEPIILSQKFITQYKKKIENEKQLQDELHEKDINDMKIKQQKKYFTENYAVQDYIDKVHVDLDQKWTVCTRARFIRGICSCGYIFVCNHKVQEKDQSIVTSIETMNTITDQTLHALEEVLNRTKVPIASLNFLRLYQDIHCCGESTNQNNYTTFRQKIREFLSQNGVLTEILCLPLNCILSTTDHNLQADSFFIIEFRSGVI